MPHENEFRQNDIKDKKKIGKFQNNFELAIAFIDYEYSNY
jgi:hypothetical protein